MSAALFFLRTSHQLQMAELEMLYTRLASSLQDDHVDPDTKYPLMKENRL